MSAANLHRYDQRSVAAQPVRLRERSRLHYPKICAPVSLALDSHQSPVLRLAYLVLRQQRDNGISSCADGVSNIVQPTNPSEWRGGVNASKPSIS